jgi:hypothetical protein
MSSYGIIESDFKILAGNGVQWKETNPTTGVRVTNTIIDGKLIVDTEYLHTQLMIDSNREIQNNNIGKKWGKGQVFARVPMNIASDGYLAEANKAKDKKAMDRWFNDSDHSAFRTFQGKV